MNKYLLFDLDGTLSDSGPGVTRSAQYALEKFGIHVEDPNDLICFLGPPLKNSFMEFYGFSEEQAVKAIEYYRERYRPIGIFENSLFPGVKHMLKALKRSGAKLAVASSKPDDMVHIVLKKFGVEKYFDVIVGAIEEEGLVEKNDVMEKALRLLFNGGEIDYDNTVMIGDRKFDILGAKTHGLSSVAIVYDVTFLDELKAAGADYIVFSAKELENLLLRGRENKITAKITTDVSERANVLPVILYDVLLPIVIYYLGSNLLRIAGYTAFGMNNPWVRCFAFAVMAIVMYVVYGRRELISARYSYRFKNANNQRGADPIYRNNLFGWLQLILMILFGVCFSLGINVLFFLTGLTSASPGFNQVSEIQNSVGIIEGAVLYGIFAPIAEELVFRGILYNRLKRFYSVTVAAVVSAIFFGMYHGNVVQGIYGFLGGILLAVVYQKSGSLIWSVILHGIINLAGFALSNSLIFGIWCLNPLACVIFLSVFALALTAALILEKKNRALF
ncbi:MAG: HAD hydrolase-like protein [Lachnospiraceae bacterium]|nr:HAD hydrolase-like protein [Lachnospiraceae bacterium]